MVEEDVFIAYADDVVVEDTGVDGFGVLLGEEEVGEGDLVDAGDGLGGF